MSSTLSCLQRSHLADTVTPRLAIVVPAIGIGAIMIPFRVLVNLCFDQLPPYRRFPGALTAATGASLLAACWADWSNGWLEQAV